jgi:HSP20 family molecular chaperone IbpA
MFITKSKIENAFTRQFLDEVKATNSWIHDDHYPAYTDPFEQLRTEGLRSLIARTNVEKTPEGFRAEYDMPGLIKTEISVSYNKETQVLSVGGKTNQSTNSIKKIRSYSFSEVVADVDPESVEVLYEQGVVTVTGKFLKRESSTRTFQIK